MAFCTHCGTSLPPKAKVCPKCGTRVDQESYESDSLSTTLIENSDTSQEDNLRSSFQTSYSQNEDQYGYSPSGDYSGSSSGNYGDFTSAGQSSFLGGVVLADGEKVVRQYLCSERIFPPAKGYLTVTNQRVLFQSNKTMSRIDQEVTLDSVSALDCYCGWNVNVFWTIIGVWMVISALGELFMYGGFMAGMLIFGLLLGVLILFLAIRKTFILHIYSSKAIGIPISAGCGPKSLFGNGAIYSLKGRPTYDTDRMINELGALVHDLQTQGDAALSKWS